MSAILCWCWGKEKFKIGTELSSLESSRSGTINFELMMLDGTVADA